MYLSPGTSGFLKKEGMLGSVLEALAGPPEWVPGKSGGRFICGRGGDAESVLVHSGARLTVTGTGVSRIQYGLYSPRGVFGVCRDGGGGSPSQDAQKAWK